MPVYGDISSSVDIGESKDEIGIYRIAYRIDFDNVLYHKNDISLNGYYETSLNYWNGKQDDIYGIAFSPVLLLTLCNSCEYKPYIELGSGPSLISDTKIDSRNMSSIFQFENRIGFGVESRNFNFYVRYMHYSNAGIKQPNQGIDIFLAGVAIKY